MARTTIFLILVCFSFGSSSPRPHRTWKYNELTTESDLVVIARLESVEEFPEEFDKSLLGSPGMEGEVAAFSVLSVLKGNPKKDELIQLVYFVISKNHQGAVYNGPDVPRFLMGKTRVEISSKGLNLPLVAVNHDADYLLFLKARGDGRYQPTSGYVDSNQSARLLSAVDRGQEIPIDSND